MIQRQTWLSVCDGTNAAWLQAFHLYGGSFRRTTALGLFLKGSVRVLTAARHEYRGFKFKQLRRGAVVRMLVVRQRYNIHRPDGAALRTVRCSGILIKKRSELRSKYNYGPAPRQMGRKRLIAAFGTCV